MVAPAADAAPVASLLRLDSPDIIVSALKPSDDGKALIVRLYNPTGVTQTTKLDWNRPVRQVWLSSAREEQGGAAPAEIPVPQLGTATLRVEQ